MLLCLRPATVSTVGIQLWHDTTEARSGESQVESQAMRAAVRYGEVSVKDGWRSWRDLVFIFKPCIICVFHGLRLKAALSNGKEGKTAEQIHYTCAQRNGKEPGSRAVIPKLTCQQRLLCVNLSVIYLCYNMIMSFRRLNLLRIMLWPIRRQNPHSYIPQYARNKSVFSSTDKTMGGNCGSQCDCQAWVEGQVWPSCTTLWSKRLTICVRLIYANKQHSLEFPTDQPGIYLKTRELVKNSCRGTSPSTP